MPENFEPLKIGKGRILREGNRVAILSLGTRLEACLTAADMLALEGISATVADARFAKPFDEALLRELAEGHQALAVVEEGVQGGFGSLVITWLANNGLLEKNKGAFFNHAGFFYRTSDNGTQVRTGGIKRAFDCERRCGNGRITDEKTGGFSFGGTRAGGKRRQSAGFDYGRRCFGRNPAD